VQLSAIECYTRRSMTRLLIVLLALSPVILMAGKSKTKRVTVSGTIVSKTSIADIELVSLNDNAGTDYSCVLQNNDARFVLFHEGDMVLVVGNAKEGSTAINGCSVVLWTSH
jgi:hypothetical protein